MPSKVYSNVEDHRAIDNNRVCEDVTSFTIPTVSHPTTSIDASGMAMAVDIPNHTHLEAMEFAISHNNGKNCAQLATPGKHVIEVRAVRQLYNVPKGESGHGSVKFRLTVIHKSTEKGTIETGNPYGSTDKFSVLRYEELINGKQTVLIDAMAGIIQFNGKNYTDPVQALLN